MASRKSQVSSSLPAVARIRLITRALRHRNYQLFFFGQGTSLVGTWMQRIALGWLVYRLTNSAVMLGVVGFSSQIFTFVGPPFAGVLADRTNRQYLIVATQTLAMVQAFALAALTLTGTIAVWHIIVLSVFLGLVNSFDIPIRQSFVVEMLESKEDLPNAIALNSFLVNGAKLVGPSVGGVLVALVGEGVCFLVNGISFMAVIGALLAMKVKRVERHARKSDVFQNLKEGVRYALGSAPIRAILGQAALISLMGMSYMVLLPVFAKDILHGDSRTFGFLMAATGVGALGGAVFLASRENVRGLGRVIALAGVLFGACVIAFSFSKNLWLSVMLLVLTGFGAMAQMASCNTLLQTIVEDDKRGRVMSFYTMAFMGMGTFGSLLMGWLADALSPTWALTIGGAGCMIAGGVFAARLGALRATGKNRHG